MLTSAQSGMMEGKTLLKEDSPYTQTMTHWPDGTVILLQGLLPNTTQSTHRHKHTPPPPSLRHCLKHKFKQNAKALEHNVLSVFLDP